MEGEWVQVEAGAKFTDNVKINNPHAELPNQEEHKLLGKQWTPPLKEGNPPVLFQQEFEATYLYDATSSDLAFYGDHTAADYINSKKFNYIQFNCSKKQYTHNHLKSPRQGMASYDIFSVKVTIDGDKFVFSLPAYKGKPNKH
eukprot:11823391-Ditylum_brightwellii.AAC.1